MPVTPRLLDAVSYDAVRFAEEKKERNKKKKEKSLKDGGEEFADRFRICSYFRLLQLDHVRWRYFRIIEPRYSSFGRGNEREWTDELIRDGRVDV